MSSVQFNTNDPSAASVAAPPLQQDEGRPLRQLKWDESNHFSIITQLHGSVIPKVVPFCIVNSLLTAVLYELKKRDIIDLTSSPSGHKYLAVIMSFLLVSRVKIMYDRYMHSATAMTECFRACRETVQYAVTLSRTDMSDRAKQWRHDVAHAVIVMLRVTAAVLEFQSNPSQVPWALDDIHHHHTVEMQDSLFLSPFTAAAIDADTEDGDDDEEDDSLRPPPQPQHQAMLAHTSDDERTMLEEACRAPIVLAFNVRKEIMKQRDGTWLETKKVWYHPCNEEMRLLDFVGDFLHNFHSLRKLIVTPLPFPLVNMSKIFLFLWVFTVPFAVCHFDFKMGTIVPAAIIFLITFGFMGIEYVAMELSDPFGNDPSDFDDFGMAQVCFEDMYLAIYKCDGPEWAQKLRQRTIPVLQGSPLEKFQKRYQDNWKTVHPVNVRSSVKQQQKVARKGKNTK